LVLKSCEPTGRDRLIKQFDWSTQSFGLDLLGESSGREFMRSRSFRRGFTLPEDADSTNVMAEFRDDGVLKVHLPTTAIARSKAIQVKVA
jgi:hypothetical protein